MVKVTKFGGSSLADSYQFKKVKDIIFADSLRKVVVVSAPGKRNKDDNKITDLLYLLEAHLKYGVDYKPIYKTIKDRFFEIKNNNNISFDLDKEFEELEKHFNKNISEEFLVSRGENITAKLLASYLNYVFMDAQDLIKFKYDGTLDEIATNKAILEAFNKNNNLVIPGFYGAYPNGSIKLLSRGGSDVTGAIVSSAISASLYENWTDVSGIKVVDPKIIANPKQINEITYDELRELSYMGASVLHEETIFPVQELNIPIKILNTNAPNEEGTTIYQNCQDKETIITGIAGKKDFTSFNIVKNRLSSKADLILKVLQIFNKFHINVEHIPTGIDTFSVVVMTSELDKCYFDLLGELNKLEDINKLDVEGEIALVAVVGRNMALKPGTSGKIFALLGENDINIKMIAQGANEINIIVGVKNSDFEKTIKVIYENLA